MSYEAAFWARREGALGEFSLKWLTVDSDDIGAAIAKFRALGFETRGGTIMNQAEATAAAQRIGSK